MNFQKIALKQLLKDRNIQLLNKLTPNLFSGAYKNILNLFDTYYAKHKKLPTKDEVIALFQSKLPEDKAETYTAIINSLDKIESELSADELLSELRYDSVAKSVDKDIEQIVELAEEKDLNKLKVVLSDLQNKIKQVDETTLQEAKNTEFRDINLSFIDNCIDTLQVAGVNYTGLSLILARSGEGKSILAIQQALHTYNQGHNVGFLSLELSESLLLLRMYSNNTQTPFKDILKNNNKKEVIDSWKSKYFNKENKFYIQHKRYTMVEIKEAIQTLIDKGCKLIVVDYLNLVNFEGIKEEWRGLTNLVKELHDIATEAGVCILSPTQIELSENKNGKVRATTRGAQELEFSSSVMVLIYQDDEEKAEGVSRIIVQKARNAPKLSCMVKNDFEHMQFVDLTTIVA